MYHPIVSLFSAVDLFLLRPSIRTMIGLYYLCILRHLYLHIICYKFILPQLKYAIILSLLLHYYSITPKSLKTASLPSAATNSFHRMLREEEIRSYGRCKQNECLGSCCVRIYVKRTRESIRDHLCPKHIVSRTLSSNR